VVARLGEAEAFHFCGHIYTTDSCPHPTGLPRIDRRGYPLRARDGKRLDDLGRVIDGAGNPLDEDGAPLTDPEGRPLPAAPRSKVCTATGTSYDKRRVFCVMYFQSTVPCDCFQGRTAPGRADCSSMRFGHPGPPSACVRAGRR
jgi:hypothetical protein